MKKMAIISSYNESCGNATFTKCLYDSIKKYTDWHVDVIELKLAYLQSVDAGVRKLANLHIDHLVSRLKKYDAVNIQLENGLYGTLPYDIYERVVKLALANKNTSVTLHSVRLISQDNCSFRKLLKSIFKFELKSTFKFYLHTKKQKFLLNLNKKLINIFVKNDIKLITHTKRAHALIHDYFGYNAVYIHPLCFFETEPSESRLIASVNKLFVKENVVNIGIFGYISAYKGVLDAIWALDYLPENYRLLVFGRQHPQTIVSNGVVDEYLNKILCVVKKKPYKDSIVKELDSLLSFSKNRENQALSTKNDLTNRVLFLGELEDDAFLSAIKDVDVAWLPYYENGQEASGVAALCIKYAKRVLCSTSFAFDELFKIFPVSEKIMRFDIGNYMELAQKTQLIMDIDFPNNAWCDDLYNLKTQANMYVDIMKE